MSELATVSRRQFIKSTFAAGVTLATGMTASECSDTVDTDDQVLREKGNWRVVPEQLTMVPIHAAVLHTGEVLFWAPDLTQVHPDIKGYHAWPNINQMNIIRLALFNPLLDIIQYPVMRNPRNLFCAGQAFLPNGDLLLAGGHAYPGPDGEGANHKGADRDIHVFDPKNRSWERRNDMEISRWYPTCTALADGRILIVSGYSHGVPPNPSAISPLGPPINPTYDLFDPTSGNLSTGTPRPWMRGYHVPFGPQTLYPFVKLLPGGSLFVHNYNTTRIWSPIPTGGGPLGYANISGEHKSSNSKNFRTYPGQGACVLLPLSPQTSDVRVLILGGGGESETTVNHATPATDTAEIFDYHPNKPPPYDAADGWRPIPRMRQSQIYVRRGSAP